MVMLKKPGKDTLAQWVYISQNHLCSKALSLKYVNIQEAREDLEKKGTDNQTGMRGAWLSPAVLTLTNDPK